MRISDWSSDVCSSDLRYASLEHVQNWRAKHGDLMPDFPARHRFGFADAFPFLITNQRSLDELNRRLQAKGQAAVPMNRFRPNIEIGRASCRERVCQSV